MLRSSSPKDIIRRAANRLGVEILRYRPERSEAARLRKMLSHHGIDVVLDVGANVGQYAKSLRAAGYKGRIVSFEPLSLAHERLLQISSDDASWDIATRSAIGDREGEIEINVSANSVSSSVLSMHDSHATAAPNSRYVGKELVRMTRLDCAAREYVTPQTRVFVKIDTQGYEDKVLNGASGISPIIRGMQLEMSLVPLYQGQQLFDALLERVRAEGYSIWSIWPGFWDPTSGRMLQVDVVLFRS